jgi:glycosyltransferase involved in cell wall biosynthesis
MPVFNQEASIESTLHLLSCNLVNSNELILIDDCSEDGTLDKLLQVSKQVINSSNFTQRITILRSKKQEFETACDFEGFSRSLAPYVLEVQADMQLMDPGFDKRMILALQSDERMLMISGRGTHTFAEVAGAYINSPGAVSSSGKTLASNFIAFLKRNLRRAIVKHETGKPQSPQSSSALGTDFTKDFMKTGRAGRLDHSVETRPQLATEPKNMLYLGQTVMRGPLMVDKAKYLIAGGFDVEKFFLGFDDHELALSSWINHGMRVGYILVDFVSPRDLGATRREKSLVSQWRYLVKIFQIRHSRRESLMYTLRASPKNLPENEIVQY